MSPVHWQLLQLVFLTLENSWDLVHEWELYLTATKNDIRYIRKVTKRQGQYPEFGHTQGEI
jgi:hypothetical protein